MSLYQSWTKVSKLDDDSKNTKEISFDDSNTEDISFGLFYFVDGIIPLVTAFCNELGSDLLDESQRHKLKQFGDAVLVSSWFIVVYYFC